MLPLNTVILGDCLEVLKTLPDASVDAVVTDPPAGISFMGKTWDKPSVLGVSGGVAMPQTTSNRNPSCRQCGGRKRAGEKTKGCTCEEPDWNDVEYRLADRAVFVSFLTDVMRECLRVLKPGGHALVWSLPRTSHWTALAIEDAGFEIRDCIHHVFGQGFPKSLNIGKALDKMAGRQLVSVERVKQELRRLFDASGKSRAQIDQECGFRASNYLTVNSEGKRPDPWFGVLPSQEKWAKIKLVLGCSEALGVQLDEWLTEAEREVVAWKKTGPGLAFTSEGPTEVPITAPATDEAKKWEGWGTALKPAVETWWLVRKPIEAQNVAAQVLATGTGAINIDGTRVGTGGEKLSISKSDPFHNADGTQKWNPTSSGAIERDPHPKGRWPSNLVLSHSPECQRVGTTKVASQNPSYRSTDKGHVRYMGGEQRGREVGKGIGFADENGQEEVPLYECVEGCPVKALDQQSGDRPAGVFSGASQKGMGYMGASNKEADGSRPSTHLGDFGGASRYFANFEPDYTEPFLYTGKASKADKNADLDEFPDRPSYMVENGSKTSGLDGVRYDRTTVVKDNHPTVKSQALMTYLVRLVTPRGGIVLDPFAGSGSTLVAAITEGMKFIGIEREPEYHAIATTRTDKALQRAESAALQRQTFDLMDELPQE